jgi:hypothetical protein
VSGEHQVYFAVKQDLEPRITPNTSLLHQYLHQLQAIAVGVAKNVAVRTTPGTS